MTAVLSKQARTKPRIVALVLMTACTIDIDSSDSNSGQEMFDENDSNWDSESIREQV